MVLAIGDIIVFIALMAGTVLARPMLGTIHSIHLGEIRTAGTHSTHLGDILLGVTHLIMDTETHSMVGVATGITMLGTTAQPTISKL